MAGYKLFLKAGSEPDVEGDTPVATLDSEDVSWTEAIATLALDPDAVYGVALIAFNDSGISSAIRSTIRTNELGEPLVRPAVVNDLRVRPLAGGNAEITFEYFEPLGIALADSFQIEITSLDGGDPIDVDDVPIGGAYYRLRVSGVDGRYRVKVFSKLAGEYEPAVSGVDFALDSAGPSGQVYEFAVI